MAYGLYDGSLNSIPGLGGYLQQKQLNEQQTGQDLQHATGAMSLLSAIQQQQQQAQLKAALASGADIESLIPKLVQSGNIQGASTLAQIAKEMQATKQAKVTADMMAVAANGTGGANLNDPNFLRRFGVAMDKPAFLAQAQHLEDQQGAQAQLATLQSQPAGLAAGQAVPGTPATIVPGQSVPPGDMQAFLKVAQASAARQPATSAPQPGDVSPIRAGGNFAPLMQSEIPGIAARAKQLQSIVDSPSFRATPESLKMIQAEADRLTSQETQLTQAKALADRSDVTRNRAIDAGNARVGLNSDGTPNEASGGVLTPEAIDAAANRYRIDGTLPPNMGRGGQGVMNTNRILNKAAEQAASDGDSGEAQRLKQLANKASAQGLGQLSRQEASLGAFEKTALANADLALKASEKVDRTGIPVFNRWLQAGRQSITGDEDARVFNAANGTFISEYAKVMGGGTGSAASTEGAQSRAQSLINTADTKEQYRAVIAQLRLEMRNRMEGFSQQKSELINGMRNGAASTNGTTPPPPAGFKPL